MKDPRERLTDVRQEHAVCGSILADPDVLIKLVGRLKPGDFSNDASRWVYEAALSLYEQQQPIDHVTLCDRLDRQNRLGEIGGAAFLSKLLLDTPSAYHAETYAENLIRLSTLRGLVLASQEIAKLAYSANGESLDKILEQVRTTIDKAAPVASAEGSLSWEQSIDRFLKVQKARNQIAAGLRPAPKALTFPWPNTLGRFKLKIRPGTLALVVAASSVGKTTFMECCADWWAALGFNVAFFHLELSQQYMLDRRTCRFARVPLEVVESRMPNEDIARAKAKMDSLKGTINYEHCPGWSARQIAARTRELHVQGRCDVAIVDYLQKMRLWMPRGYNKNDGLADGAEVLKNTCEQLGVGAMMASQVNKKAHDAGRVTAAHVRGTGEADEKGNITIVLERPILEVPLNDGEYKAGERSPVMGVRVDKNTYGPTGDAKLFIEALYYAIKEVQIEEVIPW